MIFESRRTFLKWVGAAGVTSLQALPSLAKPRSALAVTPVADGVALVTGAGGNVVLVKGPRGLVVIDSGDAAHGADLFALIRDSAGGKLPVALFNTHWHWDHTGSNERFGKAGVPIIAHENTKLWLGMEFTVAWENRDYLPRSRLALPTQSFFRGQQKLDAAGLTLEYGWLPRAHTDGDIYVHIPERNVLVAGDLFAADRYPVVDVDTGGWIGRTGPSARIRAAQKLTDEEITALRRRSIGWSGGLTDANFGLLDLCNDDTIVIPGKGAPQRRADLAAHTAMLDEFSLRLDELIYKGIGIDEILALRTTAKFDATRGDPTQFITNSWRSMRGYHVGI
ncbi:MAG: MBL fold metallo-hydrolase [Gammaproteobacteria bacterium]|nr:MBL fold metallo-hydrolase [Gammaproteobacteria bacterium]